MIPNISIRAFVHSPDVVSAIESALGDRHLARAQSEVFSGGITAAAKHHAKLRTPDVLIVEVEKDVLDELQALADVCDAETRVLVIGHVNDVTLYKSVIQQGVSEYLVAPIAAGGVVKTLLGLYENGRPAAVGKVYAFISARGGAGSSALSHAVADSMGERADKAVMLADLNMGFGSAFLALDIQAQHKLSEAFKDPAQMDSALLDRILIARGKHLRVMASSNALIEEELTAATTRRLIELGRESFRNIVLDLPAAWTPAVKEALLLADEVVITALPDLVSLRNTRALLDYLARTRPNDPAPKLILNQVGQRKRREFSTGAFSDALKFKPTLILKADTDTFGSAANAGKTLAESAPRNPATRALAKLAEDLMDPVKSAAPARRGKFWRRK